jgi:hypothetical protein
VTITNHIFEALQPVVLSMLNTRAAVYSEDRTLHGLLLRTDLTSPLLLKLSGSFSKDSGVTWTLKEKTSSPCAATDDWPENVSVYG